MRIESNAAFNTQYLGRSQEVLPAKTLLEVQQVKAAWEIKDQLETGNRSPNGPESGMQLKAEANAETSSGIEDKTIESLTDQQKMVQRENQVRAHEAAHKAAAGQFAGPITYSYAVGPDGKRYIVGGEVSIHTPASSTPEETIRNMEQVKRAALAPGDPSPQDMAVAAQATMKIMQARREMAREELQGEEPAGLEQGLNTDTSRAGVIASSSDAAKTSNLQSNPASLREEEFADQEVLAKEGRSQEFIKKKMLEYQQLIQWLQPKKSTDYTGSTLDIVA